MKKFNLSDRDGSRHHGVDARDCDFVIVGSIPFALLGFTDCDCETKKQVPPQTNQHVEHNGAA